MMPKYSYIGKSQNGETKTGEMEAASEIELARILRQEGHVLISASAANGDRPLRRGLSLKGLSLSWRNVSLNDKLIFVRNLKVMVGAGISLPKALKTMA